jgi:hypothetical protein
MMDSILHISDRRDLRATIPSKQQIRHRRYQIPQMLFISDEMNEQGWLQHDTDVKMIPGKRKERYLKDCYIAIRCCKLLHTRQ